MKLQQDHKTYPESNKGKDNKFELSGFVLWNTGGGSPLGQAANNNITLKGAYVKCKSTQTEDYKVP